MRESDKKVLVVDDDEYLLEGTVRVLRQECNIVSAPSGSRGLALLKESGPVAVIVSDFQMPEMDGVSFLREAVRISPESVPVMLTGHADMDVALTAFHEARVYRFLVKPCPNYLLRMTVRDCLEQHRLIAQEQRLLTELKDTNATLAQRNRELTELTRRLADLNVELDLLSRVDPLTGLLNRRAWTEALALGVQTARDGGLVFAISLLDVDEFKRYNDCFGHAAGDECLSRLARAVQRACREGDICGRYGGEKLIVAGGYSGHDSAVRQAEALRRAVFDLGILLHEGHDLPLTVSIGCAASDDPAETWEALLRRADEALCTAKRSGRNSLQTASLSASVMR